MTEDTPKQAPDDPAAQANDSLARLYTLIGEFERGQAQLQAALAAQLMAEGLQKFVDELNGGEVSEDDDPQPPEDEYPRP